MSAIRIGAVSYLNTLPLVHGLDRAAGLDLSFATPAELADRMTAGKLDMALLPVIALEQLDDLELVPGLGIVTRGATRSVLLVSKRPVQEIASLALDPESRTSNVLAQVLLFEQWGLTPRCEVGSLALGQALADHDAAVRIGDKALFEPWPEGVEVHDLGTLWTDRTGLPFVFAAWAARPGVLDRELYRKLHDARRAGAKAIDAIVEAYTFQGRSDPELAREYLTRHIHFRLGSPEIRAMELFFGAAASMGLIEHAPRIRLGLQRWSSCHEAAAERRLIERGS